MLHVDYAQTMLKTFIAISLEPVNSLSTKQKFLMILWMYVTAYSEITSSLTFWYSIFGKYLVHLFFSFFTSLWFFYKYNDFLSGISSWSLLPFFFWLCWVFLLNNTKGLSEDMDVSFRYILFQLSVTWVVCLLLLLLGWGKKNVSCL